MRKLLILPVAASGLAAAALTGPAIGSGGHSLGVQQNVRNTMQQNKLQTVVVHRGLAVYYLSGERKGHPLCSKSNGCFAIWKPVKAGSKPTKAGAVKGKLGVWNRSGLHQLTLGGHPLYTFFQDTSGVAGGDTIHSFGGTWHVLALGSSGGSGSGSSTSPANTTPTTQTTPTTPTTCLYPPCY